MKYNKTDDISSRVILNKAVKGIMELGIEFSYGIKRTKVGDGYEISITNITAPEYADD